MKPKIMKILQVVNFFKPSWESGGPAKVAYGISKKLVENGHDVTVYTTDGYKSRLCIKKNEPVDVEGIKTYYFRNLSSYLARKMVILIPYYLPIVARKEIKDFDVIHIHESRTMLAIVVHYYANKYEIPYILQAHGSILPTFQKQRLKTIFDIFFGYRILKDAAKVIALTKTEAEQYKKMGVGEDRIEIVPNGLDFSEYGNLPKRGEFRKKYGINEEEKIVLYVGRLHKTKGIDLLVKAFADASTEFGDAKLVIVGPDDGYKFALEELVKSLKMNNNVLFIGFISNNEKMAAFVDGDVFVMPSFSGFPITFLEACACGTPIITTNNGDELDWIHDKVGYVVDYDKDQLRDAISKVMNDQRLRRKFGIDGKQLIKESLGWSNIIGRIENLYEDVTRVDLEP